MVRLHMPGRELRARSCSGLLIGQVELQTSTEAAPRPGGSRACSAAEGSEVRQGPKVKPCSPGGHDRAVGYSQVYIFTDAALTRICALSRR